LIDLQPIELLRWYCDVILLSYRMFKWFTSDLFLINYWYIWPKIFATASGWSCTWRKSGWLSDSTANWASS